MQAITSWNANVVRVPLNETCWLGINGVAPAYAGDNYRRAITDFVALLNRAGLVVILDLHWSAAGTAIALGQAPMPDRDHTPEFWRQVATTFKGNDRVMFDLFNEPFPDNNSDTPEAWRCWRDGGTCSGMTFQAAGMQELVDAVRGTGASNVILIGGIEYAARLTQWLAYRPTDPGQRSGAGRAAGAAGARGAGARRPRQDLRRLAHELDGCPARQLPRLGMGRVGIAVGPDRELRRDADAVRANLQDALRIVGRSRKLASAAACGTGRAAVMSLP
ncbi:MAG: hypothetical protein DMD71_10305 [Gemmatimonadetes bacterium]|nr:MAG: hypothetical protein DMD71_10305 [Gemmatimonadota bacterium]